MVKIKVDGKCFEYHPNDENKTFGLQSNEGRVPYLKDSFYLQTYVPASNVIKLMIWIASSL